MLCEINFGDSRWSKTAIFTKLEALNFEFLEKFHTEKCKKFPASQNSELIKWLKLQFLTFWNQLNCFHVKYEWQKNPEFSTLWKTNTGCLSTVWIFKDFSVTLILREINFQEFELFSREITLKLTSFSITYQFHLTMWKFQDFSVTQILRKNQSWRI